VSVVGTVGLGALGSAARATPFDFTYSGGLVTFKKRCANQQKPSHPLLPFTIGGAPFTNRRRSCWLGLGKMSIANFRAVEMVVLC
jgi:hypothetical protein